VSRALGTEIDGILGYAVFADLLLTYDYPAGEVRVGLDSIPADAPGVIPMSRGDRPFLTARLGADTMRIVLDTGFNGRVALADFSDLPLHDGPRVVGARVRVDGFGRRLAGRLVDDLHLGPVVLRTPVVTDAVGRNLLGQGILADYVASLDRARGRARLVTAGGGAPTVIETPPLRGTGIVAIPREFHLEVVEVSPGSSAEEAGLREGDRVVEIDGVPVANRECPSGDEPAAAEPRVLTIERGAERFRRSLLPGVLVR
jgi:membrane-associated protease RseP (regulator of RpoE activity)